MLTKTCWRRTRVLLVMIFANDFAHRRNIVAGGDMDRETPVSVAMDFPSFELQYNFEA